MSEELNNENITSDFTVDKVEEAIFETPEVKEDKVEAIVESVVETPKAEPEVVSLPAEDIAPVEVQAVGAVAGGAIGVTKVVKTEKKPTPSKKKEASKDTVALFSTRNVTWSEVGKVYRGYNIVEKNAADKWLTRDHIRLATPEEVAKEFGK